MHESKAHNTVFYVRNKRKKKGAITITTAVVCVYFETTENTPDMGVKLFFLLKKFHRVFGSRYHCGMARYSNINQNSRAATAKFCYSQGTKQWLIKINCYLESRAQWNALTKNWPA